MVQQYKGYYAAFSAKLRRSQIPVGHARTRWGRWDVVLWKIHKFSLLTATTSSQSILTQYSTEKLLMCQLLEESWRTLSHGRHPPGGCERQTNTWALGLSHKLLHLNSRRRHSCTGRGRRTNARGLGRCKAPGRHLLNASRRLRCTG